MARIVNMHRGEDGNFHVDGVLEDILKQGEQATSALIKQGTATVKAAASSPAAQAAVENLIRSTAFNKVLEKVEDKAREGVAKEATKNAFPLIALAVSGGVIGGTLFKGVWGKTAAGALLAWAIWKITRTPPAK